VNLIAGKVVRVIDGDTIVVEIRIRTRGSSAELGTPEGDLAAQNLKKVLPKNSKVTADLLWVDSWGRVVAVVKRGGL